MIIPINKLQVDATKFKPTQNENNNYEIGEKNSISAELLTLLVKIKGDKLRIGNYDYFVINGDDYPIILRDKYVK